MSVRGDVADLLRTSVHVPVYDSLHDGMAIPSIVVYPDRTWLTRDDGSYGNLVWSLVATILVGRASLDGIFDRTETIVLEAIDAPLGSIGATWNEAGNYRTEQVAGVDYVAVDLLLRVNKEKERTN